MLVARSRGFIFIKTRKTGGTSLEIALSRELDDGDTITPLSVEDEVLRRECGGRGPANLTIARERWGWRGWWRRLQGRGNRFYNHMPAAEVMRALPPSLWQASFKFTIERNPWDLAVSAYHWHFRHGPRPPLRRFLASRALAGYSNWPLYTVDDRIVVDHVIRYEDLAGELAVLAPRLNLSSVPQLPQAKAGFRTDRRPYQELLGPEERELVARAFAREIRAFGWVCG